MNWIRTLVADLLKWAESKVRPNAGGGPGEEGKPK